VHNDIVTELDGLRLLSTIEIIEEEPGVISLFIEGPVIEFDEEDGGPRKSET
jgi:hypothetical protein